MYNIRPAKRGMQMFFSSYKINIREQDIDLILSYKIDLTCVTYITDKKILSSTECSKTHRCTVLPSLPIIDTEEIVFRYLLESILDNKVNDEFLDNFLLRLDLCFNLLHIHNLFGKNIIVMYKIRDDTLYLTERVNVYELKHRIEENSRVDYRTVCGRDRL